jgi:hypothetical protein
MQAGFELTGSVEAQGKGEERARARSGRGGLAIVNE